MIQKDATYVVMGLLDPDSIAYSIGETITRMGGKVIYTAQNERMHKIFFNRNKSVSEEERSKLHIEFCDITDDAQIEALFEKTGPVAGVVHSIAYSNPKTCLGQEFHTDAYEDLKNGFHISCVSLASVARFAYPKMTEGGSIVCLSFASQLAYPYYNWMGVNKAALEAVVRGLARRHGKDSISVNAVSAGPLATKAAGAIPGFQALGDTWTRMSPIAWDPENDRQEVANAAVFLLSPYARKITGQVLYVDGGASIVGGELMPFEKA